MTSWKERKNNFRMMPTPKVGTKLIWVKGTSSRDKLDEPLMPVWFINRSDYNWLVMDADGHVHQVMPTRVYSPEQFQDWLKTYEEAEPHAQVAVLAEAAGESSA